MEPAHADERVAGPVQEVHPGPTKPIGAADADVSPEDEDRWSSRSDRLCRSEVTERHAPRPDQFDRSEAAQPAMGHVRTGRGSIDPIRNQIDVELVEASSNIGVCVVIHHAPFIF
jgi:hypothetical protein